MSDPNRSSTPEIAAIIVAAGRGRRMASDVPKQYMDLGGTSVLSRSAAAVLASEKVTSLTIVIHSEDRGQFDDAMADVTDKRLLAPVVGGATRAASVLSGLESLRPRNSDIVLIHDAARVFCDIDLIERVIAGCLDADGAFAALPVVDALWQGDGGHATKPVSRDALWRAQTPQGFAFEKILSAHRSNRNPDAADDVAVAREFGLTIRLVQGSEDNFKITTTEDLKRAAQVLAAQ